MKKKIGIIGLGHISEKYKLGLEQSPFFCLTSVCDISPHAENIGMYHQYPFYQDYETMIKNEKLDYVLISTPPRLHYEMALSCLKKGCHVLLEKPGALKYNDLINLLDFAEKSGKIIDVIYHWRYGNEVLFIEKNLDSFGKIKKIDIKISDPYLEKPKIIDKRYYGLEGCWIDSSCNFLSLLDLLVPLKSCVVMKHTSRYDQTSKLPYECKIYLKAEDVAINVSINWCKKKNEKVTVIESNQGLFEINHSKQTIYMNSQVIYRHDEIERLSAHYLNYFKWFDRTDKPNIDTLTVHKIALSEWCNRRSKNGKKQS